MLASSNIDDLTDPVVLERGSNFRDIGGYPTYEGSSVRRGRLFRSGALGLLTERDISRLDALGGLEIIDLRCSQERELMETRARARRIHTIDYPYDHIFKAGHDSETRRLYELFPELVAPQIGVLMRVLAQGECAALVHCSAGQDRTGVVIAVVLTALGVKEECIVDDYLLSHLLRCRWNEIDMERIAAVADRNPVAAYYQSRIAEDGPESLDPRPLIGTSGRPHLLIAFDRIASEWGGVVGYLASKCGVDARVLGQVRRSMIEDGTPGLPHLTGAEELGVEG